MAFNSVAFLFGLLPVTLLCYYLCPARLREGRNLILLLASLGFYAWGGLALLPALLVSCLINWGAALLLARISRKKALFTVTVLVNVLMLGYYKYTGFLLGNLKALGLDISVPAIALPAGISFFVFQSIGYLTDVYRGKIAAERNFLRFLMFTSFFPQLLQGPILRWNDFGPALTNRRETISDAAEGAVRFCFGLAKKVLLADAIGQISDAAFASGDRLTVAFAWLGAIAYTLQLYFDFSGYTDMAIGLGRVFGFRIPENFNYPYIAQSANDFWRRWHITLSRWFRDYIYIPLGGNRVPLPTQLRNLLAVWLLTGLWHGSAWNFVLWGLYYFLFLTGEKYLWGTGLAKLPRPVRHLYAMVVIIFGWVLFRATSLDLVVQMVTAMFGFAPAGLCSGETLYYLRQFRWELLIAIPAMLPVKDWLAAKLTAKAESGCRFCDAVLVIGPKALGGVLLVYSVVRLLGSTFRSFLYFQF